jgi:hypothetical protein
MTRINYAYTTRHREGASSASDARPLMTSTLESRQKALKSKQLTNTPPREESEVEAGCRRWVLPNSEAQYQFVGPCPSCGY